MTEVPDNLEPQNVDPPIEESNKLEEFQLVPVTALLGKLAAGEIDGSSYNGSMLGHRIDEYLEGLQTVPFLVTEVLGGGNDNIALRVAGEIDGHDRPVLKIGEGLGPKGYQGSRPFDAPLLARGEFTINGQHPDGSTVGYWYVQPYRDIKVNWEDFKAFRSKLEAMGVNTDGTDLGYPDVGQVGYDEEGNVDLLDYNAVGDSFGQDYADERPGPTLPKPTVPFTGPNEHVW